MRLADTRRRGSSPPQHQRSHQKTTLVTAQYPAMLRSTHHHTLASHYSVCWKEDALGRPQTMRANGDRPLFPPLLGRPNVSPGPYSKAQANIPQNTIKPTVYIMCPGLPPRPRPQQARHQDSREGQLYQPPWYNHAAITPTAILYQDHRWSGHVTAPRFALPAY